MKILKICYSILLIFTFEISAHASELQVINEQPLSQKIVRQSIHKTLTLLNNVYVYPKKAKIIQTEIIKRMDQGAYNYINSKQKFASVIGAELREISKDSHLSIMIVKNESDVPTHIHQETEDSKKFNFAFQKVEVLSGNVGYMKFNKFYQNVEAKIVVDHAFGFLNSTDAMIIDLRDCIGGSPELVRYMLSYFFENETKLWSIFNRNNVSTYDSLSIEGIGSRQFKSNYPLFILTGPSTASAAEYFSYTLKHFGKAKIVGEKTAGAAHMVGAESINQYFNGRFSMYRPINPITKSDWEAVGVIPNIASNSELSLEVAHSEALKLLKLSARQPSRSANH